MCFRWLLATRNGNQHHQEAMAVGKDRGAWSGPSGT
jgi:hypothetical protein